MWLVGGWSLVVGSKMLNAKARRGEGTKEWRGVWIDGAIVWEEIDVNCLNTSSVCPGGGKTFVVEELLTDRIVTGRKLD